MAPNLVLARALLVVTEICALYSTWGLLLTNGSMTMIEKYTSARNPNLPGTAYPVKTFYTGVKQIDEQLTLLAIIFWQALDGSMPDLSLFSFGFAGQAAAAYILLLIEGYRKGNQGRLVSYISILGFVAQNVFFAATVPLYLLLHLSTSPTVSSRSAADYAADLSSVNATPVSTLIGFIIPAILMSLPAPSIISLDLKQNSMAIWQIFPITIAIIQPAVSFILSRFSNSTQGSKELTGSALKKLRPIYLAAFLIAAITRIGLITAIALNFLFPALFSPEYRDVFAPAKILKVASYTPAFKPPTVGESTLLSLQYDEICSAAALIVWTVSLYLEADSKPKSIARWATLIGIFLGTYTGAGFAGVAILAIWARDELIISSDGTNTSKKIE